MKAVNRFFALLSLTAASSLAVPIFVNGAPNASSGNEMTSRIQADDFTLSALTSLTGVRFWAFYFTDLAAGYLGEVEWTIYSQTAGQPGTILFSGLATPSISAGVADCCAGINGLFSFGLPNVLLSPGTYWLGLHNGPTSQTEDENFYWQTTDTNASTRGLEQAVPFGSSSWSNTNQEHAFELDGTISAAAVGIPEPSTFYLTGIAMAIFGWKRRTLLSQ